jgi:hypothetical protein
MSIAFPLPRQTRQATLTAGAGQTVFGPFDFILFDPDDVEIRVRSPITTFVKLADDQYVVAPASPVIAFPALFTVTLLTPRQYGDTVWIKGARTGSRTTDVTRAGKVQSQPLETEFDRIVATEQELRRDIDEVTASLPINADDILADAVAARDASQAAASLAAGYAAALGNAVHQYDTRAQAIAAVIPAGVGLVLLLGRGFPGDLGGGLYKKLGGAPGAVRSWHWQNTAAGTWWQLVERTVNPRMFGSVGNNVADDYQPLRDCGEYLAAFVPGGTYNGIGGDIYKAVITTATPDLGLPLPAGIKAIGNGAAIRFSCAGHVYGMRPLGSNRISGWDFKVVSSTGLSATPGAEQAIWHAPIAPGCAYGDGGTVASPSAFCAPSDIEIDHCLFDSVRNNGQGGLIQGFGGGDNIDIHDNTFPDNATICIAIGFDWLPQGAIDEANLTATKAAYLAIPRTAQTLHWSNIKIRYNRIGKMTMPATLSGSTPTFGSHGIRLSGAVSWDVSHNTIGSTSYCGIFITGGDLALEYTSDATQRVAAFRDCYMAGNTLKNNNSGLGIAVDCYPDNIYGAFTNPANPQYPYAPIYLAVYPTNMVIENNKLAGNGASGCLEGIFLTQLLGGSVRGNAVQFHKNGISLGNGCVDTKVTETNYITNCREAGILVHGGSVPPKNCIIHDNAVFGNYTAASGAQGNICIDNAIRTCVSHNHVGAGEATADVGINNTANAVYTTIEKNHVEAVKAGGIAYKLANVQSSVWVFQDNKYDGADTYLSGLDILPVSRTATTAAGKMVTHYHVKQSAMSGNKPNAGAYVAGDTLQVPDATNTSDVYTSKCTVAGAQGTWKTTCALP